MASNLLAMAQPNSHLLFGYNTFVSRSPSLPQVLFVQSTYFHCKRRVAPHAHIQGVIVCTQYFSNHQVKCGGLADAARWLAAAHKHHLHYHSKLNEIKKGLARKFKARCA